MSSSKTTLDKTFGRLGNRLFQLAFVYAYAKDHNVDIFLQDPKYFDHYASDIKDLFGGEVGFVPLVSIHLRRGDYVENPFYVDLSQTDYYQEAIKQFPGKTFLVFSDDIPFAKEYFKKFDGKFLFSSGNDEWEDLMMMASCEGNIIANSSFSWWAAYLNRHPTKKVVAPKEWYTDGVERTICPKTWIKI